jgi:hypothetical protein
MKPKIKTVVATAICITIFLVLVFVAYLPRTSNLPSVVSSGVVPTTASFAVYLDGTDGLYKAKDTNGSIRFTSNNPQTVLANVIGATSDGDVVVIKKDVTYGTIGIAVDAVLLVRTTAVPVSEGQVVFYNVTDNKCYLTKADSPSTLGNGIDIYLVMWNATANKKILLLEDGYVTDSAWSWTAGDSLWVSASTAGGMIPSYPDKSGDQALCVGTAYNATSIHFASVKVVIGIT